MTMMKKTFHCIDPFVAVYERHRYGHSPGLVVEVGDDCRLIEGSLADNIRDLIAADLARPMQGLRDSSDTALAIKMLYRITERSLPAGMVRIPFYGEPRY